MKPAHIEMLRCPACGGRVEVTDRTTDGTEIVSATLNCAGCRATYAVSGGVPRLVEAEGGSAAGGGSVDEQTSGDADTESAETADAFGWQWTTFSEIDAPTREQFLDWIEPLEPEFFAGKRVLDAGCGMGRFTEVAASFGPELVVGVDLSRAVDVAYGRSLTAGNMAVVQGDIRRLPFGADFDFIYSIGVVHHMPDPRKGFLELVKRLKPGAAIYVWVYGAENNAWISRFVDPVRTRLTSRLPRRSLYGLSWLITALMQPVLKLSYRPLSGGRARGVGRKLLPYFDYFAWLSQFRFRHNHHVVFDHLVAPVAHYVPRDEFEEWFRGAGLQDVTISWRNRNSWRGFGVKPA